MSRPAGELPIPDFYRPASAGEWSYEPDQGALLEAARAWRTEHGLTAAAADERTVHLLLVDPQRDFCLPAGSLFVGGRSGRGAVEDSRRTAELVYRQLHRITAITVSLDTHHAQQIFSPSFWVDDEGRPLAAHRTVSAEQVAAGEARPAPELPPEVWRGDRERLVRYVEHYTRELETSGRYPLYLWPPHCLLGSAGHAVAGVLQEARLFHAWARGAQSRSVVKGEHPLTEHYSIFRPEVLAGPDGEPLGRVDTELMDELLAADALLIAGQAASHCVRCSAQDLLAHILSTDPALARKVYLLTDCMSAVAVPDGAGGFVADFTADAEGTFAELAAAGMRLVRSTDPMEEWLELA